MPLMKGSSSKVRGMNVKEFAKGKTFKKTSRKFGKKRALKQAVAVSYGMARKSGFNDRASK